MRNRVLNVYTSKNCVPSSRHRFATSLGLTAALVLAACGGSSSDASTDTDQPTAEIETDGEQQPSPPTTLVEPPSVTEVPEVTDDEVAGEDSAPAGDTAAPTTIAVPEAPFAVEVTEDIDVTSTRTMDVYEPTEGGPWPVVVMWHGADTSVPASNSHRIDMTYLAPVVAEQGAVVFNVSYSAMTPADAVNDTGCSLQLAVESATDFGGDPERVVLVGNSFGGAAALIWGLDTPFRNEPFTDCAADADSVQVLPDAVVAAASGIDPRNLSVASWQQADDAVLDAGTPMLLVGGNPDLQVFFATQRAHPAGVARPEDSIALHEALLAAGYESTLIELTGDHATATGAFSPEFERLVDLVVAAIDATDN